MAADTTHDRSPNDFLSGGGEMGQLIRTMDWSGTALGPIETWPQSLRTAVSLCLASNFPINIVWGACNTQIYNDGYRIVCGEVHPAAIGQDYSVTWASAWPAIGKPFERAWAGETSYLENQRMFLSRNGYLEETFFTFSLSPIRDESGGVCGLFHPVTETTATMLSERRTRALRDLAGRMSKSKSVEDVFVISAQTLAEYDLDLPFVLFFALDQEGQRAELKSYAGIDPGTPVSPVCVDLGPSSSWPFAAACPGSTIRVEDLAARFGPLSTGPYPEPPKTAFAHPILLPGGSKPVALMIAGVSPRLPLNDAYSAFYDLLAAAVTTAVANAQAYEEERRRAEALAEIDRAKTLFFSNVSHEFRTPLTLMTGPIEELLAKPETELPESSRALAEVAHRNSARLLKLVNTLLDFSRIEAGRVQATFAPTDLAALTAELASNFRSATERAGLALTVECSALPKPVYVDREMWEKILLNLLSNAFKFTFEGGITIALRAAGDHAELTVRDTGTGIPPHEIPRLFERFHRVEGARGRSFEGSGIGLALVNELVKMHGGEVQVESQPGRGSSFIVRIPFGTAHLPAERVTTGEARASMTIRSHAFVDEALRWLPDTPGDAVRASEPSARLPMPSLSLQSDEDRPRVVLADDNADMRAYVKRILEESGYEVHAVPDGEAALASLRGGARPDLLLTDVMMPRLDGFGLLSALRSDPDLKGLLVILLSARAGEEARLEGLAAGADDYLVKPFSARELLARVDGAVRLSRLRRDAAAREAELLAEVIHQRGRAELSESERRLGFALEAGRLGSWELDIETGTAVRSQRHDRIFGYEEPTPEWNYETFLRHVLPDDRESVETRFRAALDGGTDWHFECRIRRADNHEVRCIEARGSPRRDRAGCLIGFIGVVQDITERKQAEAHLRLMVNELNHRVKNSLATVQAIAAQTFRGTEPQATAAFNARIMALARAHDLLTEEGWDAADLGDVIAGTIEAHQNESNDRIRIGGPQVRLTAKTALSLAMATHELVTNAVKYGALSNGSGAVDVTWSVVNDTEERLRLFWRESGGPPVVPPTRKGFGSRLVERGLAAELGGRARIDYEAAGVVCTIEAPVAAMTEGASPP